MKKIWQSVLLFGLVITLQALVYLLFIKPVVVSWGATGEELNMSLAGDDLSPRISSTRAMEINASSQDVWNLIVQLGADRGGSFSYTFLEKAMGYKGLDPSYSLNKTYDMTVGRIIPGSIDPSSSVIEYSFEVLAVEEGESFVLKNWGAFVVRKLEEDKSRLVIRTHGNELNGFANRIEDFIMIPLHFLMERRMILEFKSLSENREGLSQVADIVWFSGIVLSMIGCIVLVFRSRSYKDRIIAVVLSIAWLWPLLVLNPVPIYGVGMLVLVLLAIVMSFSRRKRLESE